MSSIGIIPDAIIRFVNLTYFLHAARLPCTDLEVDSDKQNGNAQHLIQIKS